SIQFGKATEFVRGEVTQAHVLETAIRERPLDSWPRGTRNLQTDRVGRVLDEPVGQPLSRGHVVLGWPGSPTESKGYFEPGGSFSPWVGSFGVSIWRSDRQDKLEATSETIPANLLRQQYVWKGPTEMPGLLTESPYYRALWSTPEPGVWSLRLETDENAAGK